MNYKMPKTNFLLSLMLVLLASASGCGSIITTPIGKILADPYAYNGKTVTIEGNVTSSLNVVVLRTYSVRDASGEIAVVARDAVPKAGTKIRVSGKVNQALAVGDKSLVVLHELPD